MYKIEDGLALEPEAVKLKMLLIDEDDGSRFLLKRISGEENFKLYTARCGREGITMTASYCPDVILLDIIMPDCDGISIIRKIRSMTDCPLIVLTEDGSYSDKVKALDEGADDYVMKPFNPDELMARIRSVRRRQRTLGVMQSYSYKGLKIDFDKRQAMLNGKKLHLSPVEYRIMEYLAMNAGAVITYGQLLEKVWGTYMEKDNKILRVNITNIRKKIEADSMNPVYIFTEPRVGYYMPQDM